MYTIECNNCRETNQLNEKMKNTTVRCHICKEVIQIGEVKKEVVKNINKIDDHEIRINGIEKKTPVCPPLTVVGPIVTTFGNAFDQMFGTITGLGFGIIVIGVILKICLLLFS